MTFSNRNRAVAAVTATFTTLALVAAPAQAADDKAPKNIIYMIGDGMGSGHDNSISRNIEETMDFNNAVDEVVKWVEENSNWDETLLIVTADHDTGYLAGAGEKIADKQKETDRNLVDPNSPFTPLTGDEKKVPGHVYLSGDHTNQLVPFFFKGAGYADIIAASTEKGAATHDKVRGDYIDNTTVAKLTLDKWWTEAGNTPSGDTNNDTTEGSAADNPALIATLAIAGIAGLLSLIALLFPFPVDRVLGPIGKL